MLLRYTQPLCKFKNHFLTADYLVVILAVEDIALTFAESRFPLK